MCQKRKASFIHVTFNVRKYNALSHIAIIQERPYSTEIALKETSLTCFSVAVTLITVVQVTSNHGKRGEEASLDVFVYNILR